MRFLALLILLSLPVAAAPAWVEQSNLNAKLLLDLQARYSPEGAGRAGVEGVDEQISDLSAVAQRRLRKELGVLRAEFRKRAAGESHPQVRQDLQILINSIDEEIVSSELNQRHLVQYRPVAQLVFQGLRALLDDQVPKIRRRAALVRLKKYTGLVEGFRPITLVAEERIREGLGHKELQRPFRGRVEQDLARADSFLSGIGALFDRYKISGYQDALDRLKTNLKEYHAFVRKDVLPQSRSDFRQPPEIYAQSLKGYGIDIPPQQLASIAHASYQEIQKEMADIAERLAKEKGANYRDVIRRLKREQLVGDSILPHYQQRLKQLEEIVRSHDLVSLPSRPARIRLATAAETAAQPAPNMQPPRLVGNTGEQGTFVLPLNIPDPSGKVESYDDFTFAAASWTLTAHELRPGHEMQFAAMVESGVSTARALFAFNSVNVEGWGLYSEAVMKPYLPLEGQLICLQHRLLRAARAYLDPELQMGKVTPDEAMRILTGDVVLSNAMARQEVERYTFRAPGQATAYFYGFIRLMELRRDVERKLGTRFKAKRFHDFVLAKGLLPPDLLRAAVMTEFVSAAGQ
ncbi:MAG: DUF885 domain-containing protein [Bryobacteraceae bacterium]